LDLNKAIEWLSIVNLESVKDSIKVLDEYSVLFLCQLIKPKAWDPLPQLLVCLKGGVGTYIANIIKDITIHLMACKVYIAYADLFLIAPYYALLFNLKMFLLPAEICFKYL